ARPQGGSGICQPAGHDNGGVEVWNLAPVEEGDAHEPAIERQRAQVLHDVVATHHVENDIYAALLGLLPKLGSPVLLLVIEDDVRTYFAAVLNFFGVAYGRVNRCIPLFCELYGRKTDTA